jgi:hypothetical protein
LRKVFSAQTARLRRRQKGIEVRPATIASTAVEGSGTEETEETVRLTVSPENGPPWYRVDKPTGEPGWMVDMPLRVEGESALTNLNSSELPGASSDPLLATNRME